MTDHETDAIVVDNGTGEIKGGYAGDARSQR